MGHFRFAYKETKVGFVEINAENEEEARNLLVTEGFNPYICDCYIEIGELIETYNN